jgi:hypothetical protein
MPKKSRLVAIYGLFCPETGALRYVGRTADPHRRWSQHCRGHFEQRAIPVAAWCRALRERGLAPKMRVFTWCVDWEAAETRLIAAHRAAGADLLNVARGGRDIPRGSGRAALRACSPVFLSAMIVLGQAARSLGENGGKHLRAAASALRAVRRRIARKNDPQWLDHFDRNAHSHIVCKRVLDYPVLPLHGHYADCWA